MAGFYAHPNGSGQGVIVGAGAYNPARRLDLPRFFYFNTWSVKIEGGRGDGGWFGADALWRWFTVVLPLLPPLHRPGCPLPQPACWRRQP